jgi:hypothetical protein
MPRYFFDHLVNGCHQMDDIGQELCSLEQVRIEVMRALPSIAENEVHKGADQQTYTVLVRDDARQPVYTATLTFTGLRLGRDKPESDAAPPGHSARG